MGVVLAGLGMLSGRPDPQARAASEPAGAARVEPDRPPADAARGRFDPNAPPPVIAIPSTRAIAPAARALTMERAVALVEGLGSPSAAEREASVAELMDVSKEDLAVLKEAVRELRPLPPQAAVLLRDVVIHVFLRFRSYDAQPDSAFLGITLATVTLPGLTRANPGAAGGLGEAIEVPVGVVVGSRMPGLAGFRYLRDGDIILSVRATEPVAGDVDRRIESPLRTTEDFAGQIRGRRPGDRVVLCVLRGGTVFEVEVELSARPVRMDEFNTAESLRSERLTAAREYWERDWQPVVDALSETTSDSPRGP